MTFASVWALARPVLLLLAASCAAFVLGQVQTDLATGAITVPPAWQPVVPMVLYGLYLLSHSLSPQVLRLRAQVAQAEPRFVADAVAHVANALAEPVPPPPAAAVAAPTAVPSRQPAGPTSGPATPAEGVDPPPALAAAAPAAPPPAVGLTAN